VAGFALGVHRALFPWKKAGVSVLLYDAETVEGLRLLCRPVPLRSASSVAPGNVSSFRQEIAGGDRKSEVNEPSQGKTYPPPDGVAAPRGNVAPSVSPSRKQVPAAAASEISRENPRTADTAAVSRADMASPIPVEAWPAAWADLLHKTPKTPRILWSYPELAGDMSGRGDKTRSAALRKLLADIGFPPGSHAFWPLFGPDGEHSPAFFFSGISVLRPSLAVLLCDSMPESLGLPPLRPFLPVIVRGTRYVLLYDVRRLVEDAFSDSGRHTRLVRFLQQLCAR